jgi:hypothetical protein
VNSLHGFLEKSQQKGKSQQIAFQKSEPKQQIIFLVLY